MTIKELTEKRASIWTGAQAITDKATAEKRELTAEEKTNFDTAMNDMDDFKRQIDGVKADEQRETKYQQMEEEMNRSAGRKSGAEKTDLPVGGVRATKEYNDAYMNYIRKGINNVTSEERKMLEANFRDLAEGTGISGGYLVPVGFYDTLTDALKWYGGVRQSKATIMKTSSGNPILLPMDNDTTNIGELLAEGVITDAADPGFTQKTSQAYTFSSKIVRISLQLMQDSAFDLSGWLSKKLATRLGRIQNQYFTVGTGLNQPEGMAYAATVGPAVGAISGTSTKFDWTDLVNLEHSVDPAYRNLNAQFMFNDHVLRDLKMMKDGFGRPIWMPGISVDEPDTILSYEYVVNSNMVDFDGAATGAVVGLFGDMSAFLVRDALDVTLIRLNELYAPQMQVGFIAFTRNDSRLMDAGTHPIVSLTHV